MRIAVTSQNFKTVTNHAGKARRFIIFEAVFPKDPAEVERLDLPKEMSFHEFAGGAHPLDGVDALITASAGEGFVKKLSRRRIQVIVTGETDPLQAVRDFLQGTIKPAASHEHGRDQVHGTGHGCGTAQGHGASRACCHGHGSTVHCCG
jgi:predicted Fe-Mo cluster-binding NifX family protein